jgi:hypothetical protein
VISGVNHDARGGVVYRQVCPEFLSNTIGRLRPEDLFVIELNTLDLFEKTFDIPPFMIKCGKLLRWRSLMIQDRGYQPIQLVVAIVIGEFVGSSKLTGLCLSSGGSGGCAA